MTNQGNLFSKDECKKVARHARKLDKQGEGGFYTTNEQDKTILNISEDHGRICDSVHRFKGVSDYCVKAIKAARAVDAETPDM